MLLAVDALMSCFDTAARAARDRPAANRRQINAQSKSDLILSTYSHRAHDRSALYPPLRAAIDFIDRFFRLAEVERVFSSWRPARAIEC
jgi:hypothetical protein